MFPSQTTYPQFAPNQVLSNRHLNDLFEYLDEQGRLTRTHLIGIGIVCGLEASFAEGETGFGLQISAGCGVTSEGFLIRWDEDDILEFRTPYVMPEDIDYTFFDLPDGSGTYPLWELTADRNDNPDAVELTQDFLTGEDQLEGEGDEKVLLLLLECRTADNSNCTPNNCDDKGKTVETTVRPLLIRRRDLEQIRKVLAEEIPGVAQYYSLFASQASRLSLPTIKAPRWDVTNTRPVSTRDLFEAYQRLLSAGFLNRVQAGLDQTYTALAPLVTDHLTNPFASRISNMSFLYDGRMLEGRTALWYQYYYDHLVTILHAYEELRGKAEELFSLCNPDGRIFPRHLALHHFNELGIQNDLRHNWVSSPAQNQQSAIRAAMLSLFERLVELVNGTELPVPTPGSLVGSDTLTANPATATAVATIREPLSVAGMAGIRASRSSFGVRTNSLTASRIRETTDGFSPTFAAVFADRFVTLESAAAFAVARLTSPIRITPSFLGEPLSKKSIPYYYDPTDLFELWNYELTRRGKADENLGFDALEWNTSDDFVRRPLIYDLEPRDFLRIEGAVGQNYLEVSREIQRQIDSYRLPIDLVALRTGSLTDELQIEDYEVQFADLEADYCLWRERILGRMAEIAGRIYDVEILQGSQNVGSNLQGLAPPQAALLNRLDGYVYLQNSLGEFYEDNLAAHSADAPFTTGLPLAYHFYFLVLHYLIRSVDFFPNRLQDVDFTAAGQRLDALQSGVRFFARLSAWGQNDARPGDPLPNNFLDIEEYLDQLDFIISGGDAAAFQKLITVYTDRREEVLRRQLFSVFQEEHPGLQFKAGTELGGTFVLVYDGGGVGNVPPRTGRFRLVGQVVQDGEPIPGASLSVVGRSIGAITDQDGRFSFFVTELPVQLQINFLGLPSISRWISNEEEFILIDLADSNPIDTDTPIPGITEGTVIADFYLPYRCCSKGSPIQIFPPTPPEPPVEDLVARTEQVSCSQDIILGQGTIRSANFRFEISGGTAPYRLQDSAGNSQAIEDGAVINLVNSGGYTLTDASGQTVDLVLSYASLLRISLNPESQCTDDNSQVIRRFRISGGRPPYRYSDFTGNPVETQADVVNEIRLPSGEGFSLIVFDEFGEACATQEVIPAFVCEVDTGRCDLPCDGFATRVNYPMWLQRPPDSDTEYVEFQLEVGQIRLNRNDGSPPLEVSTAQLATLNSSIANLVNNAGALTSSNYSTVMTRIMRPLMNAVDADINGPLGLVNGERGLIFSASASGRFNRLVVETFDCGWTWEMSLVLDHFASGLQFSESNRRRVNYNQEQMEMAAETNSGGTGTAILPHFDRFIIDRCDPSVPAQSVCTGEISGDLELEWSIGENAGLARAINIADNHEVYWELLRLNPPVGSGPELSIEGQSSLPGNQIIMLVIDPETGCHRIQRQSVGFLI
ncbi:MAG: carboxypeptidase-like regulatory domain-containing protein [Bacteroidota bacterium]